MYWFALLLMFAQTGITDGERFYQEGRFAEAASAYQSFIRQNPGSAEAWEGMGRTFLRLGRPRDAVVCFNRALSLKPGDVAIELALARSFLDGGDPGAAISLLDTLDDKRPEVRRLLGEAMYRSGYYARALQLLDKPAAVLEDRQAAGMYAVSLAKTGNFEEAGPLCIRLLNPTVAPLDLDVVLTYVEILENGGQAAKALEYADLAVRNQPDNPAAHLWKARLLWHLDQVPDAAREAEKSVALAPDLPFARSLLLEIYRKQGRAGDARREADWLREYNNRLASRGR